MKIKSIYCFLSALLTIPFFGYSQPCTNGRYATDVFANVSLTSNITYGANASFSGANTSLKLDFYSPTGDTEPNRPLIIWVHGGSFLGGSKTDVDVQSLSQRFAKKGFVCASIDYRVGFFPIDSANAVKAVVRAVQDLKAAIRFFYKDKQTTDTYKIDTTRIFIGGSSAGAITALHAAYLNDTCEISDYLSPAVILQLGNIEGNSGNAGFSTDVKAVINLCGALARYSWLETSNIPMCSMHGTSDGTVKYNRGIVNPGTPLMYLDGSRLLHERACAVNVQSNFYTFSGAGHCPYLGTNATALAYMDTTEHFVRDFLVQQLGCNESPLQLPNAPLQAAILYPAYYCNGTMVNETCLANLNSMDKDDLSVKVFPNPMGNELSIFNEEFDISTVTINDLMGRIAIEQSFDAKAIKIDCSRLTKGTYYVTYTFENGLSGNLKVIHY
jgi:alpha/beta superfamily hydrolase